MSDSGGTIEVLLQKDHERIDGLFEAYGESASQPVPARREAFAHFRTALERHIRFEEERLFPAFTLEDPDRAAAIDRLKEEHQRILAILPRIDALIAPSSGDTLEVEEELVNELWAHNAREESGIYASLERTLTLEVRDRLGAEFRSRSA